MRAERKGQKQGMAGAQGAPTARQTLAAYGRLWRRHGRRIPLVLLLVVLHGAALFLLAATQGGLLSSVAQVAQGAAPPDLPWRMAGLAAAVVLLVAVSGFVPAGILYLQEKTGNELREALLGRRCRTREEAAAQIGDSDVFTRLNDDVAQCLDTIGYWVDGAYFNPIVSGLFSLAAVGAVDWRLGLFSLAAACLICLPLGGIRRRTTRMQQQMQEEKSGLAQCYSDLLGGAEEVRSFGLEGWMEGKTARRAQRLGQTHTWYTCWNYLRLEWFTMGYFWTTVGLVALGGWLARQGALPFSAVLSTLPLAGQVMQLVQGMGSLWAFLQERQPAMGRVFAVLDAPAEEEEPAEPAAPPQGPCGLKLEHVTFGYEPGKPVWQDLSLEIQPGEAVALVGESGSGKSTLFKLLMGLYQPQEGRITVDGKELGQMGLDQWRQHFAYVQQDGGLFDRTIGENIALGCGGTLDQQALDRAAEDAGALPVIQAMPLGYEQPVGEGGRALSGGQRQRIAIARGLAAQAPILLLDEPTSALDPQTEEQLRQTIRRLQGKHTIFLITHSPSFCQGLRQISTAGTGPQP